MAVSPSSTFTSRKEQNIWRNGVGSEWDGQNTKFHDRLHFVRLKRDMLASFDHNTTSNAGIDKTDDMLRLLESKLTEFLGLGSSETNSEISVLRPEGRPKRTENLRSHIFVQKPLDLVSKQHQNSSKQLDSLSIESKKLEVISELPSPRDSEQVGPPVIPVQKKTQHVGSVNIVSRKLEVVSEQLDFISWKSNSIGATQCGAYGFCCSSPVAYFATYPPAPVALCQAPLYYVLTPCLSSAPCKTFCPASATLPNCYQTYVQQSPQESWSPGYCFNPNNCQPPYRMVRTRVVLVRTRWKKDTWKTRS